jgi:Nickel responsive protein SCO4226-like
MEIGLDMPKFIDSHPMGSLTAEQLKQLQNAPKDKFGVTHHDILYNKKEDRVYCVLDAPSKEAVVNHHKGAGLKVEWVHEVESTKH